MVAVRGTSAASSLPVDVHGDTVLVRGPLTDSTIAQICAAVDFLHEDGTDAVTVDLRAFEGRPTIDANLSGSRPGFGSDARVVRLLLPRPVTRAHTRATSTAATNAPLPRRHRL